MTYSTRYYRLSFPSAAHRACLHIDWATLSTSRLHAKQTISVIKAIMEGLKRVIPRSTTPAPTWNLNIVLTRLMGL